MEEKTVVKSFLQEFKQMAKIWGLVFINRPKNIIQNTANLSITARMREEIILDLQVDDYSQGPIDETQLGGSEMWVFGKCIKNQLFYIKLTISKVAGTAICISFHKAEYPMEFPLKNNI